MSRHEQTSSPTQATVDSTQRMEGPASAEPRVGVGIPAEQRPQVRGKFLFVDDEKFLIRGVTYGPFRPNQQGSEYHTSDEVRRDFAQMVSHGVNAVRTYTPPPVWFLDLAQEHGLRVMVGLPWEQHVAFLDDRERMRAIEGRLRDAVRHCNRHPAILCYAVGNEIPAPIVRWHGHRAVEKYLQRLVDAVKDEDGEALVTYVNYPTTEYLRLPFVDFLCFNVYLETQETLAAYLARLQNQAGNRPLVMAEIGLDSQRNGEEQQADTLAWQVRTAFDAGCVGAFIFAWTDEWHRGGHDIMDWDFGLTRRDRSMKPALHAVAQAFRQVPFPADREWPAVSVIICSRNGAATIDKCLDAVTKLHYPQVEVIVVDDGSTDRTAAIVANYPQVQLICTEHSGLSSARNVGLRSASGEIVAYLDDDAFPDPDWLRYLTAVLMGDEYVGIGGPNIPPPGGDLFAQSMAHAPGGPQHILITDRDAEHLPGCNMAFFRDALEEIGGFDPRFWSAGDDVDICWRFLDQGGRLGFSPAAMVWHYRRNSLGGFWRQQVGYGKAEALLEMKWPARYSPLGHPNWLGRIYADGPQRDTPLQRWRVYYGVWGSRLFQPLYMSPANSISELPLLPEWYLVIALLLALSFLGIFWRPLALFLPLTIAAIAVLIGYALTSAIQKVDQSAKRSDRASLRQIGLITLFHLLQPLARLWGRLRHGLTPWRQQGRLGMKLPTPRTLKLWSESWHSPEEWIQETERILKQTGVVVGHSGDFDRWDLEIRGGVAGSVRTLLTVEEHGSGRQLVLLRLWPFVTPIVWIVSALLAGLSIAAFLGDALPVSAVLGATATLFLLRVGVDCACAMSSGVYAAKALDESDQTVHAVTD